MAPDSQSLISVFGSSIAGILGSKQISYLAFKQKGSSSLNIPAVRIDIDEWLGLNFSLHIEVLGFEGDAQLLQEDGHLPWARATLVGIKGNWLRHNGVVVG